MTTDNRTNEPTEAQEEAAAIALRADTLLCHMNGSPVPFEALARAALVAAQDAAPQAESEVCGNTIAPLSSGGEWGACAKLLGHEPQCAPVLPSSGVDDGALANLIHSTSVKHFGGLDPRVAPIIARVVAEWFKEQGR